MKNTDQLTGNSAQAYLDLCENAPIGIFRTSAHGKIIKANRAVARMLKFNSPEDLVEEVNRTNAAGAIYADPEKWREITNSVLASDDWCTFEERFRCRDGTIITCALHLRATAGNDECAEIHGIIEDISERKKAEKSLRLSQFIIDNASIYSIVKKHGGEVMVSSEVGGVRSSRYIFPHLRRVKWKRKLSERHPPPLAKDM